MQFLPLLRLTFFTHVACLFALSLAAAERPRLAVLTDIGGDPDDQQSLVRLMHYANEFELELLVATAVRGRHLTTGAPTPPPPTAGGNTIYSVVSG